LTDEEKEWYGSEGYVKYEEYPEGGSSLGRFWTEKQLNSGCQQVTKMSDALAETYARDPSFYGSTFCSTCRTHFPVGADGEFVWVDDGTKVGT
jgi:hypothetical protein